MSFEGYDQWAVTLYCFGGGADPSRPMEELLEDLGDVISLVRGGLDD